MWLIWTTIRNDMPTKDHHHYHRGRRQDWKKEEEDEEAAVVSKCGNDKLLLNQMIGIFDKGHKNNNSIVYCRAEGILRVEDVW